MNDTDSWLAGGGRATLLVGGVVTGWQRASPLSLLAFTFAVAYLSMTSARGGIDNRLPFGLEAS